MSRVSIALSLLIIFLLLLILIIILPETNEMIELEVIEAPPPLINRDRQNVHDSNVNSRYKEKIRHLIMLNGSWEEVDKDDLWLQTKYEILNECKNDPKIKRILESNGTIEIDEEEISQQDVIIAVWHRIQQSPKRMLLQESLITNMRESYEDGTLVCLTGRIHRIIDTFITIDEDPVLSSSAPTVSMLNSSVNNKIISLMQKYEDKNTIRKKLDKWLADYRLSPADHKKFLSYVEEI